MANTKIKKVMREFKKGELHSGSKTGPKVKKRSQAVAIALNENNKKRVNATKNFKPGASNEILAP